MICQSTFTRAANWQCCFVVLPSSTLGLLPLTSNAGAAEVLWERENSMSKSPAGDQQIVGNHVTVWFTSPRRENRLFLCLDPPCYEDNTINNVILIAWMLWHWVEKNKTFSSEVTGQMSLSRTEFDGIYIKRVDNDFRSLKLKYFRHCGKRVIHLRIYVLSLKYSAQFFRYQP